MPVDLIIFSIHLSTALSISTHVNQQTPHNPTLLRPTDIQMVSPISNLERHKTAHFVEADERASKSPHRLSERLQAITLLVCFADGPGPLPRRTAVTHDDCMTSASRFAYDPDPYGTCWDSHTAFGSPWILWPDPPDRRLLTHSIEQEKDIHDPGNHFPDELSTHRSLLHATYSHYPNVSNDQNVTNSIITSNLPSHGAFSPSLPYWYLRPTSNGYLESDPHSRLVPPQDSTASSRRRRGVRAVEYGGLWINEEELLEGLTESGVKLNVHQCLWEEDRAGRPVER
ncbi:hypothetical protein HD554DRAFT_2317817 [Boletus coccyginus]|nr:hypothetical protein HD554DRAFT_2317817 [Boletus coccyginus]